MNKFNAIVTTLFTAALTLPLSSRASLIPYTDLSLFDASTTTSVVENFEAVGAYPRDAAVHSITHNGITYTGLAGVPSANVWVASAGYHNFGVPTTTSSVLTANGDESILMTLSSPTGALGFDTYLNKYGPATITVFGLGGSTLGTYLFSQDPTLVGVTSDASDITGVQWITISGGIVNTGIDNIRLGALDAPASVPEPSSLILMGLSLFGGMIALRKRRA